MAQTLSFYKGTGFSEYVSGAVYFDEASHLIKVGKGGQNFEVFSGVRSASWDNDTCVLSITNEGGESFSINLKTMASAEKVAEALSEIWAVIGTEAEAGSPATGLIKDIRDAQGEISDLAETVGDSASGLVKDVADVSGRVDDLDAVLNGDGSEPGLLDRIGDLEDSAEDFLVEDDIPVTGIKSGDKIISLDGKDITTALSISYDSVSKEIKLLGIDDEQIGDAIDCSDFIADGILESAELVDLEEGDVEGKDAGKYFKFVWNDESGKEPLYVPMSDFSVKAYTAGNDLNVDDSGRFDISLDEDIEISGVKVGNLGVDVTKLTKGMSLSEILTAMLCKDIDAKVNANPQLSNISGLPATEYEVGDTVPAFTLSTTFSDGSFASSDTSLYPASKFKDSDHNGVSPLPAGCVVGDYTWTGTNASTTNTAEVDSFEITSAKTYKVKAAYSASTAVPKTLLKNDSAVKISAGTTGEKSATISVYYKDFYGAIPASNADVTVDGLEVVSGLSLGDGHKHSTSSFTINVSAGDKGVYIWTKSTVKSFMNGSDNFTADLKRVTVNYTHGTQTTAYNLYSFPNVAGYANATSYVVTLN